MMQDASPAVSVIAMQFCAVEPLPRVRETVRPATGVTPPPRSTADSVAVVPLAIAAAPAYCSVTGSGAMVTVNVWVVTMFDEFVDLHVTVVMPIGKVDPDAGTQVTGSAPSLR